MQILNTSKAIYADENGKVFVKNFKVEAGQIAYLSLTSPLNSRDRVNFPIKRVVGGIDCENCPGLKDAVVMPYHQIAGKNAYLGYSKDSAIHSSDRIMIDWPGQYFIGTDMVAAMNEPCSPIVIELHIEQRNQSVDPSPGMV